MFTIFRLILGILLALLVFHISKLCFYTFDFIRESNIYLNLLIILGKITFFILYLSTTYIINRFILGNKRYDFKYWVYGKE